MPRKRRCEPLDTYCDLHRISQAELADRLGIPEPTARALVNGSRTVTAGRALEIEQKLGIPRETLRPDLFVKRAA
jgi:plasmid maintenance system antidote protein VapI